MSRFLAVFNGNTPAQQILNVLAIIQNTGGQVFNAWGETVLAGEGSPATIDAVRNSGQIAYITEDAIPDLPFLNLDEAAVDMGSAWLMGQSPFYQGIVDAFLQGDVEASQALPPGGCLPGDDQEMNPLLNPINLPGLLGISGGFGVAPARVHPERRALVGTIGVAVLQIDGPFGSAAAFTPDEWSIALLSLSRAFEFLQNAAPSQAHLVFTTAMHKVRLNLDPNSVPLQAGMGLPTPADYETIEASWRDPALQALGMGSGRQGFRNLVNSSRFLFNVDWGFVFVLTKYRAAVAGYAPQFRDVVISYSMEAAKGFLGILPLIFAHEIGHTTSTADEYERCTVFQKTGFSNYPNANCVIGNPLSVNCLMRDLSQTICFSTYSHFGWGDLDLDGVIDPFDADFAPL